MRQYGARSSSLAAKPLEGAKCEETFLGKEKKPEMQGIPSPVAVSLLVAVAVGVGVPVPAGGGGCLGPGVAAEWGTRGQAGGLMAR